MWGHDERTILNRSELDSIASSNQTHADVSDWKMKLGGHVLPDA